MAPSFAIPGKCPRVREGSEKAEMPAGAAGGEGGLRRDLEGDRQLDLPGGKDTTGCSENKCENEKSEKRARDGGGNQVEENLRSQRLNR